MKNISFINKISVAALTAVLSLGVISCEKEHLNPTPKAQIASTVAFDTPDRIALNVNGLYAAMKNGNVLGGRVQIYGDIRANDFNNRTNNAVTGLTVWNHSLNESSANDVTNFWTFAYQAINQCNVFIDGMDANKDKFVPPAFPAGFDATATNYVAEAKFIRAVLYHYLLQFYARPYIEGAGSKDGVILRLTGNTDATGNDLARSTVAQCYTQIIADLDFAEQNLPAKYSSNLLNTTRAHKNTAIAFKTRVYLTKGDYANVITEAAKIVPTAAPFVTPNASTNVANLLTASVNDVFTGAEQNLEMFLSMPFNSQNTPGTQNQLGFYYRAIDTKANPAPNPGGGEYSLNTAAGSIYADNVAWPANDARRTSWVYKIGTEYYIGNKYPGASPYLDRAPIIRYAEVMLSYAEALARTNPAGVDTRALALLNGVRTRSTTAAAPADNASLISAIMTERRIEFIGEGLRNQDIMRLDGTFPAKGSAPSADPTSQVYAWPIPLTERLTNKLVTQNN